MQLRKCAPFYGLETLGTMVLSRVSVLERVAPGAYDHTFLEIVLGLGFEPLSAVWLCCRLPMRGAELEMLVARRVCSSLDRGMWLGMMVEWNFRRARKRESL